MRLAPIPIYYAADFSLTVKWARESSRTTHGAAECLDACQVMAALIHFLSGLPKEEALARMASEQVESPRVRTIIDGSYRSKCENEISGSGYVLHTLEAALWSFHRTDNFRDAILKVVNLGDDADTTGAVCGQIAGAWYGTEGIPSDWLRKLAMRDTIESFAYALAKR